MNPRPHSQTNLHEEGRTAREEGGEEEEEGGEEAMDGVRTGGRGDGEVDMSAASLSVESESRDTSLASRLSHSDTRRELLADDG